MARTPTKPFLVFTGLLMTLGAWLGMDGGRQHPMISQKMGKFGTDEFMMNFAMMMRNDPTWMRIHAEILLSTLLMALAAFGVVLLARAAGESQWTPLGFVVVCIGAVLWICTYIFDGFVSPETAKAMIATQGDPMAQAPIIQTFASGQWFTIRISLYAWLTTSVGSALLGIGIFRMARQTTSAVYRFLLMAVSNTSVILGIGSLVAWAGGQYSPGPMVSNAWKPAEISTLVMYLVLGLTLTLRAFGVFERGQGKPAEAPTAETVPEQVPA